MLYLIATPIGDNNEVSIRALDILKQLPTIIVESTKESSKFLRSHGITGKKFEILNEHTTNEELNNLLELCKSQDIALISDCGTPGFCDPGANLVQLCRKNKIAVKSILGASSLMGLLSLSGEYLNEFLFRGFLSAETETRQKELKKLATENRPIVLMDTPYRLKKTLNDLKDNMPQRKILCALNLSQEDECILEGSAEKVISQLPFEKAEFMILIYSNNRK